MKNTASRNETAQQITQESISQRASKLWESYGRPVGRDHEIWLEAEGQLRGVDRLVEVIVTAPVSRATSNKAARQKKPLARQKKPLPVARKAPARAAPVRKAVKPAVSKKKAAPPKRTAAKKTARAKR